MLGIYFEKGINFVHQKLFNNSISLGAHETSNLSRIMFMQQKIP
jgi:hypothetical protein